MENRAGIKGIKASRIENGIEVCNTCVRPVDQPFRYLDSKGRTRGCISKCHDKHVSRNVNPGWAAPRNVLPKWITAARAAMKDLGMAL